MYHQHIYGQYADEGCMYIWRIAEAQVQIPEERPKLILSRKKCYQKCLQPGFSHKAQLRSHEVQCNEELIARWCEKLYKMLY